MKKLNLICASIAALVAVGSAQAGTVTSTATKIAIENFGGTGANQDAIAIQGAAISYSMTNITAVNSGSSVYFTVRLAGGKFIASPTGTFTFAGVACDGVSGRPTCAVSRSADATTLKIQVTVAASYTLGLGAFTYTPAAGDIVAVSSALGTAGGAVNATIGLVTLDPGATTALDSTTTQQTIDAPLATGALASGVKAISGAVAASNYDGKISLTVAPAGTTYTVPTGGASTQAVLGSVTFTNVANSGAKRPDGTNAYALATNSDGNPNGGVSVVVTPGNGQSFPVGSSLKLSTSTATVNGVVYPTCVNTATGSAVAITTAAIASAPKTLTTSDAVTTAAPIFVCMDVPSGNGNVATPIQATLLATVAPSVNTNSIASASGTGYNLQYNGSSVDVNTYWPAGLAAYNFTGYLRVTNTGTVPAAVSAAHLSPATGAAGNSAVIVSSLAVGQTVLLTSTQVDALVGAAPSGLNAGRIRVTAPTNQLRVQSLLQFNNGNLVEFSNN